MALNEDFRKALIGAKVTDVSENCGSVKISFDNEITLNFFHSESDAGLYLLDKQGNEIGT